MNICEKQVFATGGYIVRQKVWRIKEKYRKNRTKLSTMVKRNKTKKLFAEPVVKSNDCFLFRKENEKNS